MITIPLNDSTRAILAQVRAADKARSDAHALNSQVYDRDQGKMRAASDAWRARNPGRHCSGEDKDPEYRAASAEYDRTLKAAYAQTEILNGLASRLAAEVAALVKARAREIGDYRLPIFTYQKRPKGFRYLVDGVKARESVRGAPYIALHAVLEATVSEDGITNVAWQHTAEYSATPTRLQAKCLKSAPWTRHGGCGGQTGPLTVHCASTVLLAQVEAQA